MKFALTLIATLTAAPALAHPGHVETVAGHNHLGDLALPALVIAGVLAIGILLAKRLAR